MMHSVVRAASWSGAVPALADALVPIRADLVFPGDHLITFDILGGLAETALRAVGETAIDGPGRTLSGILLRTQDLEVSLAIGTLRGRTLLAITVAPARDRDIAPDTQKARLAAIAWQLMTRLPASEVIWLDTPQPLPRNAFLTSLSPVMADGVRVAPRRCAPAFPTTTRRPRRVPLILPRPAPAGRPTNAHRRSRPAQMDGHVRAYEDHIRDCLTRVATPGELTELQRTTGALPVEARLATWAVALTVTLISLPMALPVIAGNLIRGENLRAAALVLGLAGMVAGLTAPGLFSALLRG